MKNLGMLSCAVVAAMASAACAGERGDENAATSVQALTTVTSGSVTATLTTTSDWTAGFCDSVTITNTGSAVTNWTIKLSGAAPISSIWNAVQTTSGTTMTLTPSGNATIAPGSTAQLGFCGTGATRPALSSITVTGGGTGTGTSAISCSGPLLTGGTAHCSSNAAGTVGPYAWNLWSNATGACLTTYGVGAAFKATWNNSGDALSRVGLQWDRTKTYNQLGTVAADYAYTKTGTGGGYSYMGFYGWSVSPCVEFYIVDDSFGKMPINPGSTVSHGTAVIDGGTYNLYTRNTSGSGGSMCPGVSTWTQFYSVRQTARQCGHISVSEHFNKWAAAGMTLGKMVEGKLLVETGGGSGSVDFTGASVTAQ